MFPHFVTEFKIDCVLSDSGFDPELKEIIIAVVAKVYESKSPWNSGCYLRSLTILLICNSALEWIPCEVILDFAGLQLKKYSEV